MNAIHSIPSLSITKTRGYIADKKYLEQVNPDLIRYIIDKGLCAENYNRDNFSQKRANDFHTNERAQLEAYLNKYNKKDKAIKVKYCKSSKNAYGRVFPENALGFTSFTKKTRNTMIKDTMVDIDMTNAQPAIILNLCRANNIPCPFNEEYNLNREKNTRGS